MWGRRGLGLAMGLLAACSPSEPPVVVFAAASLADIAEKASSRAPEIHARLSVGPTSLLSQQIAQGAPADVFLAAHPDWIDRLVGAGLTQGEPLELARGRLVIVGHATRSPARSAAAALESANRIALADPQHVPAGQYAQAALRQAGLWDRIEPRVIPVADVRAALVAAQSRAVDAAIVYASDAQVADDLRVLYRFAADEAPEIRYVGVVVSDHPQAEAWLRQLEAAEMRTVWLEHGFDLPQP